VDSTDSSGSPYGGPKDGAPQGRAVTSGRPMRAAASCSRAAAAAWWLTCSWGHAPERERRGGAETRKIIMLISDVLVNQV